MKVIDRIIIDNKAPKNKNVIWIDTSESEPVQKYYWNGEWREISEGESDIQDYETLNNKPSINNVTLVGNKTAAQLGLQTTLTVDPYPTEGSTNPVQSGGVYDAIGDVYDALVVAENCLFGGYVEPNDEPHHGDDHRYYYLAATDGRYTYFYNFVVAGYVVMFSWNESTQNWRMLTLWPNDQTFSEWLQSKANIVYNATAGNLAGLDTDGNLTDSGIAASDVATTSDLADKLDAPATAGTSGQVLTSDGQGGQSWQTPQSGVSSYNDLSNKPQINSVTLSGNKSASDLGLATAAQGTLASTALQEADINVSTVDDGTFTISVKQTDYEVNLNHTHQNMAKLVIVDEEPVNPSNDTIYAQVDDASNPTEIEVLYIAGIEFVGGGVPAGTPVITKPSGTTINLGENSGSGVSKQIEIKGRNLTGDLTATVGTGLTITYNGTTGSSVTIPLVNAVAGAQVTIAYGGSGALDDGSLVISGGGTTPKSIVVVVVEPLISAIKLTGSQWLKTDYYPNALTEFELECRFETNENSNSSSTDVGTVFLVSKTSNSKFFYHQIAKAKITATNITIESLVENDVNNMVLYIPTASFFADHSVYKYEVGTNNNTIKWIVNGSEVATKNISKKTTTMPNPLLIGYAAHNDTIFSFFDLTIYRYTIKENGVNVRNYVPKIVGGVPGLYDTITDTFISSETSTEVETIN